MGYRAEKERIEEKLKLIKRISLGILFVCLVGLCIFSAFVPPKTWKYYVGKPNLPKRKAGETRVHFIDVGQGDCTLIELPDGKVALIDGGDGTARTERTVLRYLNALKIDVIDHLIITHADEDHCGALDAVVRYKKVLNAYLPPTLPIKDTEYAQAYAALTQEKCRLVYSSRSVAQIVGNYKEYKYSLSFLSPYQSDVDFVIQNGETNEDAENELSAVVYLEYQGTGALFAGDIGVRTEEALMFDDRELNAFDAYGLDLTDTEILKVAHHGSKYSTDRAWLEYLGLETAVISCGKGNEYGHPAEETLARLTAVGAEVWRTDRDGHVLITISASGAYTVKNVR